MRSSQLPIKTNPSISGGKLAESLPLDRVCLRVFILVRSLRIQPWRPEPYGIVWCGVLNLGTVVIDECSRPDGNGYRPVVQPQCNHGNKKCRGIYQAIGKNPLLWASLITAAIGAPFAIGLYLDDVSAQFLIRWTLSGTLVGFIVTLQLGRMVSTALCNGIWRTKQCPPGRSI